MNLFRTSINSCAIRAESDAVARLISMEDCELNDDRRQPAQNGRPRSNIAEQFPRGRAKGRSLESSRMPESGGIDHVPTPRSDPSRRDRARIFSRAETVATRTRDG